MTGMAADNRRSYTDRVAGRHPGLCFWSSQNVVQSMMKGETGMVISREKKPFEKEETPWRKNTISQYHTQGDNKETSHTVFFHNLTERTGKKERNFKNSYPEQPSNKRIGRTRTGEPPLITPYKHRETTRGKYQLNVNLGMNMILCYVGCLNEYDLVFCWICYVLLV